MRKHYLVYISQAKDGSTERVQIPMRYVYLFLAAALTGMFTIFGMAGSYTRMVAKAEGVNGLRSQLALSQKDYQHLETQARQKDVQAASLGSLAGELSSIYGLTAGRLTHAARGFGRSKATSVAADAAKAPLKGDTDNFSDDSYYKSLDTYYALANTASNGLIVALAGGTEDSSLGVRAELGDFAAANAGDFGANVPDMWPIMGPVNSGFGQREDPVLGHGEGEFHKGIDIGGPDGTPVHAPASGRVVKAGLGSGYGREIQIDHGNGIVTLYAHLQGFNVIEGQTVVKGEVIGYVGHSGSRVTGPNLHYEVQVRGTAVNPHRYLQTTMAQLGGAGVGR